MNIDLPIKAQGRFSVIKHTGHKFDDAGRVIELGKVLEMTSMADNYFTPDGSAFWASLGPNNVSINISEDGRPPSAAGYGAVRRTSSVLVSSSTERSLVPNADGNVWWRKTYRFSFPASPGSGKVTIRQASASVTGGPLTGGITNGIVSAALLSSPDGSPTSVAVFMDTESVDVVWEYTEYLKPETVGEIVVRTVDGQGVIKSTTTHQYTIRPANLNNDSNPLKGWCELEDRLFPSVAMSASAQSIGLGSLGFTGSEPIFTESFAPESVTPPNATVGVAEYRATANLNFDNTTSTGMLDCARFMLGHTEWQVSFTPPIQKQSRHRASLSLTLITR